VQKRGDFSSFALIFRPPFKGKEIHPINHNQSIFTILPKISKSAMAFYNEQLTNEDLPKAARVEFKGLEKNYLTVMYLNRLITIVILAILFAVSLVFIPLDINPWITGSAGAVLLLLFLLILIITPNAFKVKAYAIRSRDILYRSGLIFRTTTVLPFNRVQHVELKTGPVDRMFGLSRLKVYTAGGSQSDLTIPGLESSTSKNLKELIITKTASDEEE
jgi:membrane protein YdbS with pleckstrin-like domain